MSQVYILGISNRTVLNMTEVSNYFRDEHGEPGL